MPGQPIVVGVDDSLESAVAARAGWLLAQVAGVGCRLAHATADVWMMLDMARTGVSLDALELAVPARVRNGIQTAARRTVARLGRHRAHGHHGRSHVPGPARFRELVTRAPGAYIWPLLPIPDHHKVIRRGEPARAIAEEATAWRADVIVVGSHGKKWIDRLLIGSVTEELLNDLPAAMLVIPVPAPGRRRTAPAQLRTAVALG